MREIVDTEEDRQRAVEDYEAIGWEVEDETADRTVLKRGFRGGWIEHVLYFLLAPIYGNLVYSAYRRFDRPKRHIVRVRRSESDDATDTAQRE
ncbi:hypothetical protein [Halobellus rarus]|uniref:DUF8108 domain-containing protein n=1 Tax=Halobellus rarus TaxID=1126237 RepID=A0ABD6CQ54_9EURY|nr:hypothetical protein [Halobellus rarus]